MNKPDQPRKATNPAGKRPRTIRQQLEHDAWINHGRLATRMAGRTAGRHRDSGAGVIEPRPARNRRSLNRQDRTLLAVSLVLLLLLLFARASMAHGQTRAEVRPRESAQESTFSRPAAIVQGIELWGIEFRGDDAPQWDTRDDHRLTLSIRLRGRMNIASLESRYHDMETHPTLGGYDLYLADPDTRTDRVFQLDWKPDSGTDPEAALMPWEKSGRLLSVGNSVNLAKFSSTATGWKAQLAYSLATLLSAASLLWFSAPSHRMQAGGSPPPPVRAH